MSDAEWDARYFQRALSSLLFLVAANEKEWYQFLVEFILFPGSVIVTA